MECPNIETKVSKDLQEVLSPANEVLDRLTGKDEIQRKVYDIIYAYGNYCRSKYQDEFTSSIATALGTAMQPMIKQFVQKMIPSPYPSPIRKAREALFNVPVPMAGEELGTFIGQIGKTP
jgi:hypothetical protein